MKTPTTNNRTNCLPTLMLSLIILFFCVANAQGYTFTVRGLGGAGGLFTPSVSPYDPNFMLVACDMGGAYRSQDGGKTWELINFSQLQGALGLAYPVYFKDSVFWHNGIKVFGSLDKGKHWKDLGGTPWKRKIRYLAGLSGKPEILFVSAESGLWRSDDYGESWSQITSQWTREIVSLGDTLYTIVEPKTLYISHDRGKTWVQSEIMLDDGKPIENGVLSLTGGIDDKEAALFASVYKQGIIRSRDGGKSWSLVSKFEDQSLLQMAENQTRVIYAVQNNGAGWCKLAWRSTDGGDTWEKCFRMGGFKGNVEPSWVQTQLKWGYYITKNGFYASKSDPNLAILATQGDIYISRDGGSTWQQHMNELLGGLPGDPGVFYHSTGLEITSCWGYYFDPFVKNREYIGFTDIGFGRSLDGGKSWSWSAAGSPWSNTFYDVVFDPKAEGRMYAACSNRHDIPHWTNLEPNKPGNPSHTGGITVSEDHGTTWKPLGSGLPNLPCTTVAIDPSSPVEARILYAGIFGDGVWKSVNGGQTWMRKSNGLGNTGNLHVYRIRRHPKSGNLYCLITGRRVDKAFEVPGGIWKSSDEGETWSDITKSLALAWPTSFEQDPDDENILYVAAATPPGKPQGGVYKTVDGGKNWKKVLNDAEFGKSGGEPYDHIMAVKFHPGNKKLVYVGTSMHGLWFSVDGGDHWVQYTQFPFRNVQSITFHHDDQNLIYLTTFGAGVWVGPHLPGRQD